MLKLILILMIILPWLSLMFMNKHSIKRFMPVAILASLLVTIIFEIGYLYDWWRILAVLTPWDRITSVPLVYGVFLVGTVWIFHFTFDRKLWVYVVVNLLFDVFYSFIVLNILVGIGIYSLNNMKNFGILMLMFFLALIIYPYQKWQDNKTIKNQ